MGYAEIGCEGRGRDGTLWNPTGVHHSEAPTTNLPAAGQQASLLRAEELLPLWHALQNLDPLVSSAAYTLGCGRKDLGVYAQRHSIWRMLSVQRGDMPANGHHVRACACVLVD